MPSMSLPEVFFLAVGVGGFVRLGWCLVWLIGTEAPMPAPLDWALDAVVGAVLAVLAAARQQAVTAAALLALLVPTPGDAR